MATKSRCRPLVLLMVNGFYQAYFDVHGSALPEIPATPVGEIQGPRKFVTQKQRVKRKLLTLAILAGLGAAAVLAYLGLHLWG